MANNKDKVNPFDKLRWGSIVGVIDSYDSVHSEYCELGKPRFHEEIWPTICHKRWRWNFEDGLSKSFLGERLSDEDFDRVMSHLTRKYGIKWQENGYHDWQYLLDKMSPKER